MLRGGKEALVGGEVRAVREGTSLQETSGYSYCRLVMFNPEDKRIVGLNLANKPLYPSRSPVKHVSPDVGV